MKNRMVVTGLVLVATAAIACTGCVSIANPFTHSKPNYSGVPNDSLRQVADDVERAVQKGERDATIADRDRVSVNTEALKQAIRTRAARAELVGQLLDSGHAREGRNGLISILNSKEYKKATTPRQRDRNALLVLNENNDRWTLYEGLVKASKLPRGSLSAVQETFHQARIETMAKGQKYEDASGATVVKGG